MAVCDTVPRCGDSCVSAMQLGNRESKSPTINDEKNLNDPVGVA